MEDRLKKNIEICETLKTFLSVYPDLRFNQAIQIINEGQDKFYEEPEITLERLKKILDGISQG